MSTSELRRLRERIEELEDEVRRLRNELRQRTYPGPYSPHPSPPYQPTRYRWTPHRMEIWCSTGRRQ